jgi:hypothetical protein
VGSGVTGFRVASGPGGRRPGGSGAPMPGLRQEHGIAVSARGRIPASVLEQYQAAAKGR